MRISDWSSDVCSSDLNWSLANINRVEVLRGPQGTLYGRNSIGGAINIITTQPGEKEEGRASFTLGTRGRVNSDVYMNGKLSDTLAASFTGAYTKRGGIGNFVNLDTNREVGENRETGRASGRESVCQYV